MSDSSTNSSDGDESVDEDEFLKARIVYRKNEVEKEKNEKAKLEADKVELEKKVMELQNKVNELESKKHQQMISGGGGNKHSKENLFEEELKKGLFTKHPRKRLEFDSSPLQFLSPLKHTNDSIVVDDKDRQQKKKEGWLSFCSPSTKKTFGLTLDDSDDDGDYEDEQMGRQFMAKEFKRLKNHVDKQDKHMKQLQDDVGNLKIKLGQKDTDKESSYDDSE